MDQNSEPKDLNNFETAPNVDASDNAERVQLIAQNSKRMKKTFSYLGFALAITLCVTLVSQIFVIGIVNIIAPESIGETWVQLSISSLTVYVFGMGAGYLFLKLTKTQVVVPEKKNLKFTHWLIVLVICFGAMYTGNVIGISFTSILSQLLGYEIKNSLESVLGGGLSLVTILVYMVIIAPILEELFFRKVLIDRMLPYGEKVSIFVSALLFGLFHGNFNQFFYATILGLILGFLYCKTGDIRHTIYLHMTINFFGSIVPTLLTELIDLSAIEEALEAQDIQLLFDNAASLAVYAAYSLLIYAVWILGVVFFFLFIKRYTFKKSELLLPEGAERIKMYYLNPGMIVTFIFCAILMISSLLPTA